MSGRFNTFLTWGDLGRAGFSDLRRALPVPVDPRRAA